MWSETTLALGRGLVTDVGREAVCGFCRVHCNSLGGVMQGGSAGWAVQRLRGCRQGNGGTILSKYNAF